MTKTLKISEETHRKIKLHCVRKNKKLNEWVEECLLAGMKIEKELENARKINN